MANLQNVSLAALQPQGHNDEIHVWYQKHPGYAAFTRSSMSDALEGVVTTYADMEELANGSAQSLSKSKPAAIATGEEQPDIYKPFVSCSSFTKAEAKSAVYVFGVRDDYKVCMISPSYGPIYNGDAYSYSVAACHVPGSSLKENILLYYLWRENENKDPRLVEYSLFNPKNRRTVLSIYPSPSSRLCAYYNSREKEEYCFFLQNHTINWRASRSGRSQPIHHASGVSETSPMAICIYRDVPVLFFFSQQQSLMVMEYTEGSWQESRAVSGTSGDRNPRNRHPNSDLAAVADRTSNNIVLYYREADSENEYDSYVWKEPKIKNA